MFRLLKKKFTAVYEWLIFRSNGGGGVGSSRSERKKSTYVWGQVFEKGKINGTGK